MNDDYSYALNAGIYVYFGGIGLFVLITFICAMRWYAREARLSRTRAEEAERLLEEVVRKRERKQDEESEPKAKPARKRVEFRPVEEDDEDDEDEAPKPAGKHVYDPKQHKVVWVPAE